MKKKAPPSAAYTHRVARLTALKLCERNSSRGRIGARARDSRQTKRPRQITPPTSGPQTIGDEKPSSGCSISANTGPASPSAESAIPTPSIPCTASGSELSSTARSASQIVTAISGRLIQKIQRQSNSTSRPPPSGPDQGRDPRPRRPQPDRAPARLALEGRGEDRQRARDQQRAGHPLQRPGADQRLLAGRDRAEDRGRREPAEPDHEQPPATEQVAERAADEQQRDQRQHVGLDDPLLPREPGVEILLDRRQGDVDHGRIEEDDVRAEDRRHQRQLLLAGHRCECRRGGRGTSDGLRSVSRP